MTKKATQPFTTYSSSVLSSAPYLCFHSRVFRGWVNTYPVLSMRSLTPTYEFKTLRRNKKKHLISSTQVTSKLVPAIYYIHSPHRNVIQKLHFENLIVKLCQSVHHHLLYSCVIASVFPQVYVPSNRLIINGAICLHFISHCLEIFITQSDFHTAIFYNVSQHFCSESRFPTEIRTSAPESRGI